MRTYLIRDIPKDKYTEKKKLKLFILTGDIFKNLKNSKGLTLVSGIWDTTDQNL